MGNNTDLLPRCDFDSAYVPARDRFPVWRESIVPLFDTALPDEIDDPDRFNVKVTCFHLPGMIFAKAKTSGLAYRRQGNTPLTDRSDPLALQLYLDGGYQGVNGIHDMRVRPGTVSFLDLGRPVQTVTRDSLSLSLLIPRDLLQGHEVRGSIFKAGVIPKQSIATRILTSTVLHAWNTLPRAGARDAKEVSGLLLGAIRGFMQSREPEPDSPEALAVDKATLVAICHYIEQHLDNLHLNPEYLCRRFGCSRATLYRLFQPLGGVASHIRKARLRRCHQELLQGNGKGQITQLAYRWGFSGSSHLSRLFRQHYGLAPGDLAAMAHMQRPAGEPAFGVADTLPDYRRWLERFF